MTAGLQGTALQRLGKAGTSPPGQQPTAWQLAAGSMLNVALATLLQGGVMVSSAADLVDKLRNEAKVI